MVYKGTLQAGPVGRVVAVSGEILPGAVAHDSPRPEDEDASGEILPGALAQEDPQESLLRERQVPIIPLGR